MHKYTITIETDSFNPVHLQTFLGTINEGEFKTEVRCNLSIEYHVPYDPYTYYAETMDEVNDHRARRLRQLSQAVAE